ncbi:TPA: type II toxin-antitoxin system RnlB family antitoxin, partial [Streptococcus pyogenes]
MKRYHILNLKSDSCKVVVATSYVSPLSQVYAIANELKSVDYKGEVIFDLVLSNGFSSNRFLKTDFDGNQLNIGK